MIIPATAEVLLNHFARGMDPLSSVLAPRFYHQVSAIPILSHTLSINFHCNLHASCNSSYYHLMLQNLNA